MKHLTALLTDTRFSKAELFSLLDLTITERCRAVECYNPLPLLEACAESLLITHDMHIMPYKEHIHIVVTTALFFIEVANDNMISIMNQ